MVDPALVAVGGAAVAIGSAAIYAFSTGNEASADADIDGDGEDDASVTFNKADDSEDEAVDDVEEQADPTPDYVTEDYSGLTDIKGIGPKRAEDIGKSGLPDPVDIYYAADSTLLDVTGIGPRALEMIRDDIGSVDESGNGSSDEEAEADSRDSEDGDTEEEPSSSTDESTSEDESE